MTPPRRAATRGSTLARWQTERVLARLDGPAELVVVTTTGDRRADEPIHTLGGQGVFVKEVQEAVLRGRADLAVHSAKDLPSATPPGLVLACVPERADPRDALVGTAFDELPTGARVATGSVRRRAQLAHARPDLTFAELRGNVPTRVARAAEHDAAVVALAALERLDLVDDHVHPLEPSVLLPQVAQGALAVECRADDDATIAALRAIEDWTARRAVDAERAFLAALGGGCDRPVAALAAVDDERIRITGLIASLDGRVMLRTETAGEDPVATGQAVAALLLDRDGGRALLADDPAA
ncbi:MAG TPA: hydroxymethylbilane synthase [Acidimicrobiia bacterium]|nr:hydroxymethylbilane synthase [Acidimicrobiia bacterium]